MWFVWFGLVDVFVVVDIKGLLLLTTNSNQKHTTDNTCQCQYSTRVDAIPGRSSLLLLLLLFNAVAV